MAEQTVAKSLFVLFADIPTSRWIELTLIDEKLNNGDEVTVVYCDGVLPACTINHNADRSICNACIGRTRYHLGLLKKLSDVHSLSEYVTEDAIHQVGEISSAVFLKNLNEPCERFGYGPLSSAVSFTRDMNFSIDSTKSLATTYYRSSLRVWSTLSVVFSTLAPDVVYVHNGRLAEYQTTYLLLKSLSLKCVTHEICCPPKHFAQFTNGRIHDRECYKSLILDSTQHVSPDIIAQVAKQYFESKRNGTSKYQNFTSNQSYGQLDSVLSETSEVLTIFTSSEDEFACLGPEWDYPIYSSQISGIIDVVGYVRSTNSSVKIVVRMHPNMSAMPYCDLKPYYDLVSMQVIVVEPQSKIHSYELVDRSSKILTFGSTIGIEGTYWGKPVIQVGHSPFDFLDVCYIPESRMQLMELLNSNLESRPASNTHKFAYTLLHGGDILNKIDADKWLFKGKRVLDIQNGTGLRLQGMFKSPLWAFLSSEFRTCCLLIMRTCSQLFNH